MISTKYTVANLEGPRLDQAVAKALGLRYDAAIDTSVTTDLFNGSVGLGFYSQCRAVIDMQLRSFSPSTLWADGGPIIERELIDIEVGIDDGERFWMASLLYRGGATVNLQAKRIEPSGRDAHGIGPTPLIAAMRAFVESKLGDEVELP